MKRIFIIQNTPINVPLPLSVYLTDLIRHFKKNEEFEFNLIVSKSESIPEEIKNNFNKIYQIKGSTYSIRDNFKFSFKVNSILKKENKLKKIDIIHCLYPNSSLLGGVIFKIFHKGTELIYDIRSPWIEMSIGRGHVKKNVRLYRWILYTEERILCKFVDKFILISEGLKNYYKKNFIKNSKKKIFISPSGVDTKLFKKVKTNVRQKYGITKKEILIGYIGSIDKVRRLDQFILMFKDLPQNVKLMFVGEGDSKQDLIKLTKEENLDNRVIFVDKVPHEEVIKYISAFNFGLCHLPDIFIFRYSSPLKILEYLSCGIPVLASKINTHEEISKKNKGVFIYSDIISLKKIINNKLKHNVKNLNEYSWKEILKTYLNIYKNEK